MRCRRSAGEKTRPGPRSVVLAQESPPAVVVHFLHCSQGDTCLAESFKEPVRRPEQDRIGWACFRRLSCC